METRNGAAPEYNDLSGEELEYIETDAPFGYASARRLAFWAGGGGCATVDKSTKVAFMFTVLPSNRLKDHEVVLNPVFEKIAL